MKEKGSEMISDLHSLHTNTHTNVERQQSEWSKLGEAKMPGNKETKPPNKHTTQINKIPNLWLLLKIECFIT